MSKQAKKHSQLQYFKYFKKFIGWHIYSYIFVNFLVGLLDGFGLAMFVPLLSIASHTTNNESLGKLQFLLDSLVSMGFELNLLNALILMIGLFILKGVFFYLRILYFTKIRQVTIRKIRLRLIYGLQHLSYHGFTNMDAGKIQNNMVGETARLVNAMSQYFTVMQHIIMLLTYVMLAFASNWKFAIMVGVGGLISNVLFRYINKLTKEYSRKQTLISNNFNGNLIQSIQNFKYLKATGYFPKYGKKLLHNISKAEELNFNLGKVGAISESLREPLIIIIIAFVILLQVNVMGGSFSSILVSLLLFYRALAHLATLQTAWNSFLGASAGIESIESLLSDFDTYKEPFHKEKIENISSINLKDVSLTFGTHPVLRDINMTISQKTSIALVGESGAGKTTLANVICGLQPSDSGNIFIDGKDLYKCDINSFRKKVGYITQESVIFNDTIFNNVTFWAEKTDENLKKFWDVIQMVSLDVFVKNLEFLEDAQLGHNGVLVSGGQKQRVSIARELFKDCELLVLDEATSALDSETELHIKENIDLLQGKCTIIIIAHRLSTIKDTDVVYLLDKGNIIESGSYNDLSETSIRFKKMLELQNVT